MGHVCPFWATRRSWARDWELERELAIHCQIGADAAAIAASEVLHLGPQRAADFHAAFCQAYMEICKVMAEDTRDMEYARAAVDRRLAPIFGERLVPWEERYGHAL